ncbi:hypothetical protein FRC96_10940 [Lujinxingia vulgaris]|uniref:Pyridoxamine 5'-phosphate oxidase Alr4036 family FMN-binding domain-containing protein n=2 Tax=Lujinxingia vulgaris TaxID=2600176 RepID=A0A5C6XDJ5_9DELT|nr:hypothetical protein FRC96_10940 [Lujinxingia vulgaris]
MVSEGERMKDLEDELMAEPMSRLESLEEVLEHLWAYAERGAHRRDNAMATPIFVTTRQDGAPGARTVILRDVEPGRALLCHTDRRSGKVQDLQAEPRTVWVCYDRQIHQQFQFIGRTTIHTDDALADRMWAEESPDELVFYYKKPRPSEHAETPSSAQDFEEVSEAEARANFAVVRTEIDAILWQHVHPEGEYRAGFKRQGDQFVGEWLVP